MKKDVAHIGITEYYDTIIPDGKLTVWDKQSIIMFRGPQRTAKYSNEILKDLCDPTKICKIGDHLWATEAYATIIPNKFPLCKYHFDMMFPGLKRMLRYHYGMEQPWRRTY